MHYYFYLRKVQIRKNVLKYSNEVKILCYIPPLQKTLFFIHLRLVSACLLA